LILCDVLGVRLKVVEYTPDPTECKQDQQVKGDLRFCRCIFVIARVD